MGEWWFLLGYRCPLKKSFTVVVMLRGVVVLFVEREMVVMVG